MRPQSDPVFCASEELSGRIHKELSPDASVAAKANISPSGESAMYSNGCQFLCSVIRAAGRVTV